MRPTWSVDAVMEPHLVPGILGHIGIRPMQLKLGG